MDLVVVAETNRAGRMAQAQSGIWHPQRSTGLYAAALATSRAGANSEGLPA